MVELFILVRLSRRIAHLARSSGRSATTWVFILLVAWFAGEFVGFGCGAAIGGLLGGEGLPILLGYGAALLTALASQGTVFASLRKRIAADEAFRATPERPFTNDPPPSFQD